MRLKLQVIISIILIIGLAFLFLLVNVYKEITPNIRCTVPNDCNDLTAPNCTGGWVCISEQCAFLCEIAANSTKVQSGGLSGSTVECIEDSNCSPGSCADGYKYQKYSCVANRCQELKFFADPCNYR